MPGLALPSYKIIENALKKHRNSQSFLCSIASHLTHEFRIVGGISLKLIA
ncbi:hypothetical protein MC7420_5567 [Coleofasciculus chthonoplastes PCC 7420]|uniref:Uncharacterized protein n=1 Tax=Coleofasciculus chthonoplastes PCC 7420 TaxID=118168 RepID=B4VPV6_9CYAN|nr:hypothetical protein MC7420_5567 [Coleofasciculus chthonoplastes PCC 7420]